MKRFWRSLAGVLVAVFTVCAVLFSAFEAPVARADGNVTLAQAKDQLAQLQAKVDSLETQLQQATDLLNQALVDQATLQDQIVAQQARIDKMAPAFADMVNAQRQASTWQDTVRFLLTDDAADFVIHMGVTANVQIAMDEQMTLLGDEKQRLTDIKDSLDASIETAKVETQVQQALLDQQKSAEAQAKALVSKLTAAQRASLTSSRLPSGVKPQTAYLVGLIKSMFPQITDVGTLRSSNCGDHCAGLAADFMIPNYKANVDLGWQIANYVKDHAGELKVKYIIWQQSIWQTSRPSAGWKHMADRGSDNENHKNHVHVSFYA